MSLISSLIPCGFLDWVERHKFVEFPPIELRMQIWNGERRIGAYQFEVVLSQNGFNERRAKFQNSNYCWPCEEKAHDYYRKEIALWLQGRDIDGLPKRRPIGA